MQRQKTIAKWLAIILLITLIIACYLVFNAVWGAKNTIFPPANAGSGSSDDVPPAQEPEHQPVYSTLPRSGIDGEGVSLQHIGGEGDEELLKTVPFAGGVAMVVRSNSNEFDMRGEGLYIGILNGSILSAVKRIADASEIYCACFVTRGGLGVATRKADETLIRIFDGDLSQKAELKMEPCSAIAAYNAQEGTMLFVSNGQTLFAYTITSDLSLIKSNFTYALKGAAVKKALRIGGTDILVVQSPIGVSVMTYSPYGGFAYKCELLGQTLLQLVPYTLEGKSMLAALTLGADGVTVYGIDGDFAIASSYTVKGAKDGLIQRTQTGFRLVCDRRLYTLCTHLEVSSVAPLAADATSAGILDLGARYIPIEGSDYAIVASDGKFALVCASESGIYSLYSAQCAGGNIFASMGAGNISLYFTATECAATDFIFGGTDVVAATGITVKQAI